MYKAVVIIQCFLVLFFTKTMFSQMPVNYVLKTMQIDTNFVYHDTLLTQIQQSGIYLQAPKYFFPSEDAPILTHSGTSTTFEFKKISALPYVYLNEAFLKEDFAKQVDSGSSKHSETEHTNFDFNSPQSHIKIAEHAPYLDDPEYDAKKMEWINNYPEEYKSLSGKQVDSGLSYQKNIEVTTSDQYMEKSLGQRSVADKKWQKGGIYEGFSPKDEILEKRTQNTKHFQKDNGNIVAQIGGNYHYQDENNLWQDI